MARAAETIHSGHFMVSHFEAEAQDDDEEPSRAPDPPPLSIDTSLNKLFQCMTLAYRQKLTSPKWNRFKGVKLRWKEKIRLNNVIWRCWHMQFILKQNTPVCQFASPLDVDTHIKPEATILEGKYWKRRAEAVKAEYKKWRMYYKNKVFGGSIHDVSDVLSDMDVLDWQSHGDNSHMLVDEDYISFMSDTLFSTISNNQPFAFPDTREIARGASLADFIQPSLGPLQPNLEDFMDTFEPLQDLINSTKLPPVPEESIATDDNIYRNTFSQPMMDTSFQETLEQTSQFTLPQITADHISHIPSRTHHQSSSHVNAHQSLSDIQPVQSNIKIENQQNIHSTALLPRHEQNQGFLSQQTPQNAQIDSVITQNQSQSIMFQSFGILNSNILSQQNVIHGSPIITQQSVIPSSQETQKSPNHYLQQKMYQQLPINSYQDRNYSVPQGIHQSRIDNVPYVNTLRRGSSGSGGCIRERVSRQRPCPFVQPSQPTYSQFNSSPTTPTPSQSFKADKLSFTNNSVQDHNVMASLNSGIPQNVNLTAGIYLNNISNQTDKCINRFKMPSPPPQANNATVITLPQVPANTSTSSQHRMSKGESFRSNSLPIGTSLGAVLGNTRVRRRPRSGSSSPAPVRRAQLHTAASEPTLNPTSVLLAHFLTTKTQELYKPGNTHSLSSENLSSVKQVQQVAILPASNPIILPKVNTPSAQMVSFNASSPLEAQSPQSPSSPLDSGGKEHKRSGHIHAEQKRRYNIKNGFDVLQSLIPQLSQNPSAKVSKAAMLQKCGEYIKQIQAELNVIKDETDSLKQEIENLNSSISNCQSLLPATGAPISRQCSGKIKEMFDEYVYHRTNENWKFWIFSLLVEPLLTSFNNYVSSASKEELKRSTLLWAEQHCSLVELRPIVLNSLRQLYTSTEILMDPSRLPDEARAAINKKRSKESKSSSK